MAATSVPRFADLVGMYIRRHGDDVTEDQAQRKIGGLLRGWQEAMGNREGVMSRHDGSDLRCDELRLPKLEFAERSMETKDDPLGHVSPSQQADHAILTYHNLMRGFDSMILSDDRTEMRLHLSAEFALIRALIEAASMAVWVLAPDDSDERIIRSLRLRHSELAFSKKLAINFAKLAGPESESALEAQEKFVTGQVQDLVTMATKAGIDPRKAVQPIAPSTIASEAGAVIEELGAAVTFWYWSTASSIAHGELENMATLADMTFIGVDVRDQPIAHIEPSAVSIWNHLKVAHELIQEAHSLWNRRAAGPK